MTTTQMAKGYKCLNPSERFALLAAALHRGDEQEVDRLFAAAGRLKWPVLDTTPWLLAFQLVADRHWQLVIESAGAYLADRMLSFAFHPADEQNQWQKVGVRVRLAAYILQEHLRGWSQFCDRIGVPPDFLPFAEDDRPGTFLLDRAKQQLADSSYLVSPNESEAREIIAQETLGEPQALITATSIANELQREFEKVLESLA